MPQNPNTISTHIPWAECRDSEQKCSQASSLYVSNSSLVIELFLVMLFFVCLFKWFLKFLLRTVYKETNVYRQVSACCAFHCGMFRYSRTLCVFCSFFFLIIILLSLIMSWSMLTIVVNISLLARYRSHSNCLSCLVYVWFGKAWCFYHNVCQ